MHLIYAVLTIMLVGLFSNSMFRSIHRSEVKMVLNEVMTELTGTGYDVLEFIGRREFDENTDESKMSPLVYPVISTAAELTATADFGGCSSLTYSNPACDDIDDFDGLAVDVTTSGLTYSINVDVQYVDPLTAAPSIGKSYAKEVTLTLTNPYLLVGGAPLEVTLFRVFTYDRHTTSP